jgi:hypothetical protein
MSLREKVMQWVQTVARSSTLCSKMVYDFVEAAYMRYFLRRTSYKNENDAIPACIKGKSIANMTL